MILKECYVSSFGKLKDFRYNFNDNLNVINQENGFGKTTFSIFIKSMFYGLNDSKRDVENNERKKYKPWNSLEKFGGYITFEKDNSFYKIERFFGNKEAEDTCVLTHLDTGKIYENAFDLGKRLFEIDEEGFNSTTFFSQKDLSVKSNTSLTGKFNEVCEVDYSLSFDKAFQKVTARLKDYKYSGDRGLIPDTKRKINEVEIEINEVNQAISQLNDFKIKEAQIKSEIATLKNEINELTKSVSLSAKKQAYNDNKKIFNKLTQENVEINQKLNDLKKILNDNLVANEELNVCQDLIYQLNSIITEKNILQQDLDTLKAQLNVKQSPCKKSNEKGIFAFSLIAFICAVVCLFVNYIPAVVLFGLSILLLVYGVYVKGNKKEENNSSLITLIEQKNNQLNELSSCVLSCRNSLDLFFSRFNLNSTDYSAKLNELKNLVFSILDYEKALLRNNDTIKSLNFHNQEELELTDANDFNVVKQALEEKNVQLQEYLAKHSSITSIIKQKEEKANNLVFLENKLEEFNLLLAKQQEEMEILKITSNYLQKADENLKIKYKAPLQNALNKYLGIVLENKINVDMDIDFNLSITGDTLSVQPEYFSKGYRNIFDICKRFALIEVLFVKEKPFIILDDPFSNLDQEKIEKSLEVLKQFSNDYQVIYFTCHQSRAIF